VETYRPGITAKYDFLEIMMELLLKVALTYLLGSVDVHGESLRNRIDWI
jgi:transposase